MSLLTPGCVREIKQRIVFGHWLLSALICHLHLVTILLRPIAQHLQTHIAADSAQVKEKDPHTRI